METIMKQEDKFNQECAHKDFEEILTECVEDVIKKVLDLSDEVDKAFKERCRLFNGATIDEQLDNQRRQHTGLLREERIKYIKDHWKNTYYLSLIRNGKGFTIIKI